MKKSQGRKIFCALSGGLGNQLFQYAAGRGIAQKSGAQLVLDTWGGFVRDREYRRTYALAPLPLGARKARACELWPVWLQRAKEKWLGPNGKSARPGLQKIKKRHGTLLLDDNRMFYPEALDAIGQNTWCLGSFQSPKYFEEVAPLLQKELMPPLPEDPRVRKLGDRLREHNTVGVGVRLYEECRDPLGHAAGRRGKSPREFREALSRLSDRVPDAKIAVFCTHHARFLREVGFPGDTAFVTHEEGCSDALARLWLLTQCRHHLFNNSTFYWWGAWLSGAVFGGVPQGQKILAADNFYNPDIYETGWETF